MRFASLLLLPFLLTPALAQDDAAPSAPAKEIPAYSENTPVEKIVADPAAAAVVKRDLPGLLEDSSYSIFKSMSLKQLQAASGGELSQNDVDKCVADLQALFPH
jgi:hypothetical protein